MPRYDYECDTCHYLFELRQGFDSEPVATCPECENSARRKFHAVPIVFKGSGWYVNDYGKKGSSTGKAASDTKDSSDSKDSSESKSKSDTSSKSDSTSKSESKTESPSKASSSTS